MTKHIPMEIEGVSYIALPEAEYDELRRLAEDAEDEAAGRRVMAEKEAAVAAGEYIALPREHWKRIRDGECALIVVREARNMTQTDLARESGVARPEISDIENGKRRGTMETWKAFSKALKAPLDVIARAYAGVHAYSERAADGDFVAVVPDFGIEVKAVTRDEAKATADRLTKDAWHSPAPRPTLTDPMSIMRAFANNPRSVDAAERMPFIIQLGEI